MQASSFSSPASAASTAAIDAGRPTDSGTIVSGNSVVFCNGKTGITKGTSGFLTGAFASGLLEFASAMTINVRLIVLSSRGFRLFFAQPHNQQAVTIITFDCGMFDRARELNHFFKSAISNFQLVMRHAFAAGSIAARPADTQDIRFESDFYIGRFDSGEIDFDNPTIFAAIHVCRGTP